MSELTVRYWYAKDTTQTQVYDCDYAVKGCANITARFVTPAPASPTADTYLEIGFAPAAGALAAGQQTGEIQNRLHNQNWVNYNEANDYSFDPAKTAFADWTRVTLYRAGVLVWGTEPGPSVIDTQPPTAPANLASPSQTPTTIALTWSASTDNVGVTGYRIREGTTQVGTSTAASFTVTALAPASTHTYTVVAVDAAGNVSAPGSGVTATTSPTTVDTTPPTAPTNLTSPSHTATTIALTWTASTDGVGVTGYRIREGTTQVGTSTATSFTVPALAPASTHSYTVVAVDAAGNVSASSNAVTVTTDTTSTATLKVQYRAADTNPTNNQITPHLNIVNAGTTSVPLSELTVRYWYTKDTTQTQVYDCDFAVRGCANITARFVTPASTTATADTYLEIGFAPAAGVLSGGQQTDTIQNRLHNQNWATYNEANDYSFDPTKTAFADWTRVTLYRAGVLVWGTEPVPSVIDTQPPAAPANLASPSQTSTTIALTWTASTDNVGVTGYRIFRGASAAGTSATTSFTADGLTPSTSYTFTVAAFDAAGNVSPASAARSASTTARPTVDAYTQRFLDLYADLHGNNGYFHPSGIPYHSVETLMVEAPDHGHETTSETYSYWAWLEVMNGRITGDWTPLQRMFDSMEANIIPTAADQPTNSFYNPADPADYAPEADLPSGYPSPISSTVPVGSDPIGAALRTTYGADVYGMHWILDVDNFYRYGRRGDGTSQPSYINTFQRGPQESTWETVPHPSWEDFQWGAGLAGGFLPLFISGPAPAQQWRYTNAPDADARLIQAMYWANQFSPGHPTVVSLSAKAAQMGDFLRYGMFDKYFKTMGCASPQCPAGTGYNAAHYLMSWYYAWGGPIPPNGGWSFRIGSSHNHFGYQNPMAALGLTTVPALRPRSGAQATTDWTTSLGRQLQFYRWLQSADGGIGGGATNSWGGRYAAPPAGVATFYGMFYQENPVYLDPGSNTWFGFQAWSMERVAEFYEETNNAQAKLVLDKWIPWAMGQTRLNADGTFLVPSTLAWSGQPSTNWTAASQNWNAADTTFNANLRVTVTEWGTDLGVTAALAKTLIYYSAGTRRWATHHVASQMMAKELLDRMWTRYRDSIGVAVPETRRDYNRFAQEIFVPSGFSGVNAQSAVIQPGVTFLGLRPQYVTDPDWMQVQRYLDGGPAPTFTYHRFWAQVDIALANAEYGRLFQ